MVVVPAANESVTNVTIGSIFKQPGDFVSLDEEVVEIESDKGNSMVLSQFEG